MARKFDIPCRLAPFVDAGLIPELPTHGQIAQGEIEMYPYIISSDATLEPRYAGALLGHPVVRQPVIFALCGVDHLDSGTGIACKLDSVIRHLHFTYHQGMPVWDLQVVQTHPEGLRRLREETEAMLARRTVKHTLLMALLSRIVPNPERYLGHFLGEHGYIARAERMEYPQPSEEGAAFPPEFFSLVDFLNYCATTFPVRVSPRQAPRHFVNLLSRRYREGKGLGWLLQDPRDRTPEPSAEAAEPRHRANRLEAAAP